MNLGERLQGNFFFKSTNSTLTVMTSVRFHTEGYYYIYMHKFATNFKFNLCGLNLLKLEEGKRDLKKGGHSIAPTLRSFKIFHRANTVTPPNR